MATKLDLLIYQGETFEFTFDSIGEIDLTSGYEAKVQFRFNPLDPIILAQFTDGDGLTLNADGTVSLRIEASETIDFVWEQATYDLRLTEVATTEVTYPFVGIVKVQPSITKEQGSFKPIDPTGDAAWAQETKLAADGLDKSITLTNTPIVTGSHVVSLNGQAQTNGVDYAIAGDIITLDAGRAVFADDRITVQYQYKV
jgi:hypothetical protein